MAKLKHETELVKAAIVAGVKYAEDRGAAVFEPTDSASEKILYIYRLLVHDKVIQPLPRRQGLATNHATQIGHMVLEAFAER